MDLQCQIGYKIIQNMQNKEYTSPEEYAMDLSYEISKLGEDIQLYDYQSHPTIKAPLSN